MKNKLQKNMRRIGTKNLTEQSQSTYLKQLEDILELTNSVANLNVKGAPHSTATAMATFAIQELIGYEKITDGPAANDLMDILPIIGDTNIAIECLKKLHRNNRLK